MRVRITKNYKSNKILALASLKTEDGIKIDGFKIFVSDSGQVKVYPPSIKKANGAFADLVKITEPQENAIIEAFEKWKLKNKEEKKPKPPPSVTTAIRLNVVFHFLRYHKNKLTAFRLWFVARHCLDIKGAGYVQIEDLSRICGIDKKYLKRICTDSELFYGVDRYRVYYCGIRRIINRHRLKFSAGKIRRDNLTKKFMAQFKSKQAFEGYICKCYMENDLDPKHKNKITKGRISYEMLAGFFKMSRRTACYCLKHSNAKANRNKKEIPSYVFDHKDGFGNWLLRNMDIVIGGHRIAENPCSYFLKWKKDGRYVLAQSLPNIYDFTGFSLVRARIIRGKSK